jgi:catechol 2,3-dioxygenase-like lactoylglutathione lyase family enzyme
VTRRGIRWTPCALALVLAGCDAGEVGRESVDLSASCEVQLPGEGILLMLEELGPPVLSSTDLTSGEDATVYEVASMGFAYEFDVSQGRLALAYTPPPADGEDGFDRSWIARVEDGEVSRFAGDDAAGAWAFYPTWAADGASLWFVATGEGTQAASMLSQVDGETGEVREVVADATEPAISPRGDAMAWIAVDPASGDRTLVLADPDGSSPRAVVDGRDLGDLGQPFFSSDGAYLYFAVIEGTGSESWLDLLVPSAQAHSSHDLPGDWWRVPVTGGDAEQVTHLLTIHYDGAAGPGDTFVAATREGVVRVDPSTGETSMLRCTRTVRAVGILLGAGEAHR